MDEERYSSDGKIYDSQRLKELQALPLWRKIQITQARIMEWYSFYEGQVYISFSGGKDSTVLLNLARRIYPNIEAVFVDTGLEYPEIREFIKTFDNVTQCCQVSEHIFECQIFDVSNVFANNDGRPDICNNS